MSSLAVQAFEKSVSQPDLFQLVIPLNWHWKPVI